MKKEKTEKVNIVEKNETEKGIDFNKIESKWQKKWEDKKAFNVQEDSKKKKFYCLEMFPYPSGTGLHMGHALNYTIGDIQARFKRMSGFNVLYPMGYDAFGLPAENAAIKAGEHPKNYTESSMKNFVKQQKLLGLSYDWERKVITCYPEYYKWNQYFFLKFLEKGLVYRKKAAVNWCRKCDTVLANEQVHNGKCWRHEDTEVEVKQLEQWFIKTTDYAEELLEKVDSLQWPERIKIMQKNWIGKSHGTEILFEIENPDNKKIILVDAVHCLVDENGNVNKELKNYLDSIENQKIVLTNAPIDKHKKLFNDINYEIFTLENKPNKKDSNYYKTFLDKHKLKVEQVIYLEHDEESVESAKSVGINTLFYENDLNETKNFIANNLRLNLEKWPIFTTRSDTIYGVTFMVVSSQHPRLSELITEKQKKEVEKFLKKIKSTSEKDLEELEKEGAFTGSYAINPLTKEKVPVYAGNFVVADYGSGMVMAVPAHDQRDFEFAKKYQIPIKIVIQPEDKIDEKKMLRAYVDEGTLINSGNFDYEMNYDAKESITNHLEKLKLGKRTTNYKLRDWLVSRQRYWGTPIPIVYCESCKENIEKNATELKFYENETFEQILNGKKSVETRAINTQEKDKLVYSKIKKGNYLKCVNMNTKQRVYLEVTNVMKFKNLNELLKNKELIKKIIPNKEINSIEELENAYRFTDDYLERIKKNGLVAWEIKKVVPGIVPIPEKDLPVKLPEKVKFGEGNPLASSKDFLNVECPNCGKQGRRETDTMDTFFDSSWYYLRYVDSKNSKQAFEKKKIDYWLPVDQYIGGAEHACMHLIYARFFTKALRDLDLISNIKKIDEPFIKLFNQGMLHGTDGNKMSKSLGNVINPIEMIEKYSADCLRLGLMSFASPDSDTNWDEKIILGSHKFLNKVVEFFNNHKFKTGKSSEILESKINKTIKELSLDIENFKYNLAIIKLRQLFEALESEAEKGRSSGKGIAKEDIETFLKLLSPFAPHMAEELWEELGNKGFISLEKWPTADEKKINEKLEQEERAAEKTVSDILNILKIIKEKQNKEAENVYLYVMPFEIESYNSGELSKRVGKVVKVYAVNNKEKYDPRGIAGKSKPGRPAIFIE